MTPPAVIAPPPDCPLCPRLKQFRDDNRQRYPAFFNDPVPSFGAIEAELLIVGLAPGLKGANRTGRPFTGDYAGALLYPTLKRHGFAEGNYGAEADDGFRLVNCRVSNAARCVPPENKPLPAEIKICNQFLQFEIAAMAKLRLVLALGGVAHRAILTSLGLRQSATSFRHGTIHELPHGLTLFDSYHCSRYNTSTRRLTEAMFDAVILALRRAVGDGAAN